MNEIEIELPVERVTAFEDRAELQRGADVTLPSGGCVIVARGLTPLLSEGRITARVLGTDTVVDELRVEHRYVDDASVDAARLAELQSAVRERRLAAAGKRRARERLEARRGALRQSQSTWSSLVGRGLGRGALPDSWSAGLNRFQAKLHAIDQSIAEARRQERAADRAALESARLVDEAAERKLRLVADLVIRVSGGGGAGRLLVRAVVACALWRPTHVARLSRAAERSAVEFETFGTVWQKTGEDWTDVELVLSTARPSAGAELPDLQADRLRLREKTSEERKRIVVEHRVEAIPRGELDDGAPGVFDGGTARVFAARERVSIRGDGRPHRVGVATFDSPAEVERVAMPELDAHVFLRARFTNRASLPILAGPVTLVVDGDYVGIGDVAYVGGGDEVELSFGSDDRFVITLARKRVVEKKRLTKDRVHFLEEVEVSYSGEGVGEATVLLRMPKSEVKQLRVVASERHAAPPDPIPDEHGVVRYPVAVSAGAPESLTLAFHFDTSGDVHVPDPW